MSMLGNPARQAGLAYLGLGLTGVLGFVLIRNQLYAPGDAAETAARLVDHEVLARVGIAADLGIVLTQAVTALLFFRLFRGVDQLAAGSVAAFGLVNAVAVLVATAFSATALDVAVGGTPAAPGDGGATSLLLYRLSGATWEVGALFFGLWLIPLGWLVWRSANMPRVLGWVLVVGGVGYVLSAFVTFLAPDAPVVAAALTLPASVGEFWMIGHLLIRGVTPRRAGPP